MFSYISGTIKKRGHYPLAVNGYNDHLHILLDYHMNESIPDLVRELKKAGSKYIKENSLCPFDFQWQSGYGVFSVGWKELPIMIKYIIEQDTHHSKRSFREEYMSLLKSYEIDYKEEYVFDFIEKKL